jgi:hypothetical protein
MRVRIRDTVDAAGQEDERAMPFAWLQLEPFAGTVWGAGQPELRLIHLARRQREMPGPGACGWTTGLLVGSQAEVSRARGIVPCSVTAARDDCVLTTRSRYLPGKDRGRLEREDDAAVFVGIGQYTGPSTRA